MPEHAREYFENNGLSHKEKTRFEKDIHYCDLQDDEWEQMFV